MPSPTPLITGSDPGLASFRAYMDCIRKDNAATIPTPPQYDSQRMASPVGTAQPDNKLLWAYDHLPYRYITSSGVNLSGWASEITNTNWWVQVPWGNAMQLDPVGSSWTLSGPYPFQVPAWFISWCYIAYSDGTDWPKVAGAFQVVCPQMWTPRNYEIWKVTGRWATGTHDTGTFPSPNPWSSNTDFAMTSSGTLHPGETLIVGPHDYDPASNCQTPPAAGPSGVFNSTDGEGWGVASYLIWV